MVPENNIKIQRLVDIVPKDMFVGTSLILKQKGRFLYGLRPAKEEKTRKVIELTGIGGGIEDSDKSYSAGALREAQEEMGCGVEVIPCSKTLIVRGQGKVERVRIEGEERPAAVVFRRYRTPPHQPWHEDNQGQACLIVFAAEVKGQPRPVMELPWLIWLKPNQILETAREDVPLQELLARGAELVIAGSMPPPETSLVRLTDSHEALALALGTEVPSFCEALGQR